MVKCAFCGTENPPGTRLCTNCKFILREVDPAAFERGTSTAASHERGLPAAPRVLVVTKGMKLKLALAAVAIVVMVSTFAMSLLYTHDPSMNAILFYEYRPSTDTYDASVRVWGSVDNFGGSDVEAVVDVVVTDASGHSSSQRIKVGIVKAFGSAYLSELIPWPYTCLSTEDLTATYDILTRSAWLS